MYLRSIEIQGFKSFANKTRLDFENGITGIVGPNGSGKSNIADAVRWVLGEQKIKQLRGSKMEDVIFAGTAARKPQSYAYVSITLDNSDRSLKIGFDEVTVSRRVFRSGESEYMLNGSVCRLRDIQELFYDTGIGKEGYSIIGQGQIDKILQGKPEERRELFDEAAGIVKYKKRKNIALRKLENERLNMERVNDIITELSRQAGPLKRQSEMAGKFLKYKEELKKYDLNLFLYENSGIEEKISRCRANEDLTGAEAQEARGELEALKLKFEKQNEELQQIEEQIEALRKKAEQGRIIKENLTGQINVLNEQIRSAEQSESHYMERVDALSAAMQRNKEEEERLKQQQEENKKEQEAARAACAEQDSRLLEIQNECEQARVLLQDAKNELVHIVEKKGEINSRIEHLSTTLEQIELRKERLAAELEKYGENKSFLEAETEKLKDELSGIEERAAELAKQIKENNNAAAQCSGEISSLNKETDENRHQLLSVNSRLETIRNITERYEGYGGAVREVMKLREKNRGILGVVADIIKTEKKYEIAIETALGGSIQNIVTDTEATAKETIEYLKENKLGRATFLPVRAIRPSGGSRTQQAVNEKGAIGVADTLVDVPEEYSSVASYLLGRVLVVDNIDNAIKIAGKYKYQLMIVTLEGELLSRGGSLTGGAFKNRSNLLGRRREISELEAQKKMLSRREEELAKELSGAEKRLKEINEGTNRLTDSLHEEQILLNTAQINYAQAKSRLEELSEGFVSTNAENEELREQEVQVSLENEGLNAQLVQNSRENEEFRKKIAELEEKQQALRDQEAQELEKSQVLRTEREKLTEQSSFIVNSLIKLEADMDIQRKELEKIHLSNKNNAAGIEDKLAEIRDIEKAAVEADARNIQVSEELAALEKEKNEQSGANKEFITKRESLSETISELEKELIRLTAAREKLEEKAESRAAYIWEEYELTLSGAESFREDELGSPAQMQERITELKSSIRSLGTINVSAIEEYKEVSQRCEFLKEQYEDLKKAEADLVRIIKDLDREMRKTFKTEFAKIQAEFAEVFKEMFGGGQGSIEIEEDVDILDAGITIIAQPPGKKLQNMMQLSGGEKALTAIAVLFAIQNLKPSPFCILDEIEAALDDSNIGRFAAYLDKLKDQIQFIVITHRKGTMEAADRLYGVTMQERGVSTLISVNLEEYEEEHINE